MASRSRRLPRGIRLPEWSPENETLEHFERFAYTLIVPESGERFRLRDFQLCKLEDYFATRAAADSPIAGAIEPLFFEHLWEEPTGQGKSALQGAIALHHGTYVVPRPRVFVVGGELEHARNTTNAVAGFIHESRARNGVLGYWWESQEHAGGRIVPLWLPDPDVGIFARSAGRTVERKGGSSVEGKNPTLIIVEELHRHADGGAAVNTLKTKTLKAAAVGRTVKVIIGTTAGTDKHGVLGQTLDRVLDESAGAEVQRDLRPAEYYVRAVDADRETVAHIWEVPEKISPPKTDDDPDALNTWLEHVKRANPADWITVRTLRRLWKSLNRKGRWMFLRQNANQWITAGYAALDRGQFWALRTAGLKIPDGKGQQVFVGLDRASKWDSTAIIPVWKPPGGGKLRVAGVVLLHSPRDGKRRRTRDVGRILEAMRERWPDMVVVFDRNAGGGDVAEELEEKHGLTVIDHGQGTEFDLASMRLAEYVEGGKFEWDAPPEHLHAFADQVLAAVIKETAGGKRWRGEAPDDDTPADAFDGLAMALNIAAVAEPADKFDPDDYRIESL